MTARHALSKLERRFLSRRACAWCDAPLDSDECLAFGYECSAEARERRRRKCLEGYKPRRSMATRLV